VRLTALSLGPLVLALSTTLVGTTCAKPAYQLPVGSPPGASAQAADAGLPAPPPPSRRGVIMPGDPASGTAQLGPNSTGIEPHTGTNGTRVTPGSSEGNQ